MSFPTAPALSHWQAKLWTLPARGLAVFYGGPQVLRLSHYVLPRALQAGQRALYLDGANRFDPLLLARLARRRGDSPAEWNRRIRVARAFTCFQLTELLVRAPRLLQSFPADAVILTAMPELYFDEDVREADALSSFQRGLRAGPSPSFPIPSRSPRHGGNYFSKSPRAPRRCGSSPSARTAHCPSPMPGAPCARRFPRGADMGRTLPTFCQLVEETAQHWAKFRRALRREDQEYFDRLFLRVRSYTQAATYQCSDNPMEATLLAIALDQEKRLAMIERLLRGEGNSSAD